MHHSPLLKIALLSLIWLIAIEGTHAATSKTADGDAYIQEEQWRQALHAFQQATRTEALKRLKKKDNPSEYYSILNETDDQNLLHAHALFERGVLSFLRRDLKAATESWTASRAVLQEAPESGKYYLRRVNAALALIWIRSLQNKEIDYLTDGIDTIGQIIDDSPLPDDCSDFFFQLQNEYRLTSVRDILQAGSALAAREPSPEEIAHASSEIAKRLWVKKRLVNLIVPNPAAKSKAHEALIDELLFSSGSRDISLPLVKSILSVTHTYPRHAYATTVALLSVYAAETMRDGSVSALIKKDANPYKLDRVEFGIAMNSVVKAALSSPGVNAAPIIETMAHNLELMHWPQQTHKLEVASTLMRNGHERAALNLLEQEKPASITAQTSPYILSLIEAHYRCNNTAQTLALLSELEQTLPPDQLPSQVIYWKALTQVKQGDAAEGISNLKAFLKAAPHAGEAPEASLFLGTLLISQQQLVEAKEVFQFTISTYSGTPQAERARKFIITK